MISSTEPLAESRAEAAATPVSANHAGKYLLFHLGDTQIVAAVHRVTEILAMRDITEIPQMPAYIKGVINLRGHVIPVLDLRLRLGLKEVFYTERTCIVVVSSKLNADGKRVEQPIGLIVDGVSEVVTMASAVFALTGPEGPAAAVPPLPCTAGIVPVDGEARFLLDLDLLLCSQPSAAAPLPA